MITAQDIREKSLDKVKMGGYDMPQVDEYLEQIADEVSNMQKENTVLKSKMKVLVDKIEEYRANEEALNRSIISAQKLAVQIEADARNRAAEILADADKQFKARVGSIDEQAVEYENRLAEAQAATKKFCDMVRTMCNTQISNIDTIENKIIPDAPAAEVEEVPATATIADAVAAFADSASTADSESTQAFKL